MKSETVKLEERQKLVADAIDSIIALEGEVYPAGLAPELSKALHVLRDKLSRIDSAIDDNT